jgi:hypothetical protein
MTTATANAPQLPPEGLHTRVILHQRINRLIVRLGAFAIALLISLLLAELIVRIALPQPPSWLDIFAPSNSPAYRIQANVVRSISSGESHWTVYTDADGFRVDKPPTENQSAQLAAASTTPALIVLGDSFTFGMGTNYADSLPGQIQQSLGQRYRVINAGVPGYGPTQYRQVLERELFDGVNIRAVVIATYIGNDFHDCIWKKGAAVRNGVLGSEPSLRSAVKRNSHLYRLASNAFHRISKGEVETWPHEKDLYIQEEWTTGKLKKARALYQTEFARIRELCQERQIPLMACIIPNAISVKFTDATSKMPLNEATAALAAAGIPAVDSTPSLARLGIDKTYFFWDDHLNPTGNKIVADEILSVWSKLTTDSAAAH